MARSAVYRQVSSVRRTSVPRSRATGTGTGAGLTTSFGRMLAKLSNAGDALHSSRPKRRR
ncbi:MAG TPA: hypothetical protein VER17_01840 [Tepidisphaeraceae bacterium]|nr:hypothetical protein [Tepidisphaeraceae bacterium]